jgi:hypothetical protein
MTDRHLLVEHLTALEQQAATVAALIDFNDDELLQQVIDGFAPPPVNVVRDLKARRRWGAFWLSWLADCGERWEAKPPAHPAGETMADALLAWCRRT